MRLLNTKTLQLEIRDPETLAAEFAGYAILSHCWSHDEVLYEDVRNGSGQHKAGYHKLTESCRIAAGNGFTYIWIDTCCIDKSSSAELSEAINSMYAWYQGASVCYAYIEDVDENAGLGKGRSRLGGSRWFKRGWTLQELIAPEHVLFFSKNWHYMGQKQDRYAELAAITGIDELALREGGPTRLPEISVAKKMSWAASRETTRPEDLAYCLLGLFDVNMALLYGEGGTKAFLRLQEEIMKTSSDQSIFAWTPAGARVDPRARYGVLAKSPADFRDAATIVPFNRDDGPYDMTNLGLRIRLPMMFNTTNDFDQRHFKHLPSLPKRAGGSLSWAGGSKPISWAVLSCHDEREFLGPLVIALSQSDELGSSTLYRVGVRPVTAKEERSNRAEAQTIYIGRTDPQPSHYRTSFFNVRLNIKPGRSWVEPPIRNIIRGQPEENWHRDINVMMFQTQPRDAMQGVLWINIDTMLAFDALGESRREIPLIFWAKGHIHAVHFPSKAFAEKNDLLETHLIANSDKNAVYTYVGEFDGQTIRAGGKAKCELESGRSITASVQWKTSQGRNVYTIDVNFENKSDSKRFLPFLKA